MNDKRKDKALDECRGWIKKREDIIIIGSFLGYLKMMQDKKEYGAEDGGKNYDPHISSRNKKERKPIVKHWERGWIDD